VTIVCGTDFSPGAARAVEAAAALAARLNEPLDLVHVADGVWVELSEEARAAPIAELGARLRAEADRLAQRGLTVRDNMLTGPADEALVSHAERVGARLLVVSSLGRRAPARWVVGSVAGRTARHARIPVLVVRDAAPFVAWTADRCPLRVAVAVDFSLSADVALDWVAQLQAIGPCDVVAIHAARPLATRRRLGLGVRRTVFDNDPDVDAVLRHDLTRKVEGRIGQGRARMRVDSCVGRVSTHLAGIAAEEGADVLVVGTRRREGGEVGWRRSISRSALRAAAMSVACVPSPRPTGHEPPRLPTIRTVLAATDFSELGDRAVPFAYGVLPQGGTVHLVHVVEMREVHDLAYHHYDTGFPPTDEQRAAQEPELAARLQAAIPASTAAAGVQSRIHIIEARSAAAAIAATAERLGADMICVGSHGRSGLSTALAGSVARYLVARSGRPVVVVGPLPA
jgi:nucleotide-binding universal stress UspA family protein